MTDAYSRVYNADPGQSPDAYSRSIALKNSAVRSQGVTTLTLIEAQNGATLLLNAATAITVTIPKGLSSSFVCSLLQMGVGQVGVTPGTGVTLNSYTNYRHLAGQYAAATIQAVGQDSFVLAGTIVV
jgi:hypothetical protein